MLQALSTSLIFLIIPFSIEFLSFLIFNFIRIDFVVIALLVVSDMLVGSLSLVIVGQDNGLT